MGSPITLPGGGDFVYDSTSGEPVGVRFKDGKIRTFVLNDAGQQVDANTKAPVSGGGSLSISTNTTIAAATHAGKDIFCSSTPQLTINTGLGDTFGCNFFGAFTYTGSATIADKRVSGAANPSASLVHTPATDTYELHGSKP